MTSYKRRLRFTMRAVLGLITFLCVLLAMEVNRVHRQARALEPIRLAGGRVFYNYNAPQWLLQFTGRDFLSRAAAVDLSFTDMNDEKLRQITDDLRALPSLVWVRLTRTRTTRVEAERLNQLMPNVKVYHTQLGLGIPFSQSGTEIPVSWGETPLD